MPLEIFRCLTIEKLRPNTNFYKRTFILGLIQKITFEKTRFRILIFPENWF